MYEEISFEKFCDGFPENYQSNFSYEGKRALFDYLEQLEDDTGEKIEFDPIALCVEFTEYDSPEELQKNYNDVETMEKLEEKTTVIEFDDRIIIQDY